MQGGFNFQPDKVFRVLNASLTAGIGDLQPLGSDQREQHLAGTHRRLDLFDEVVAGLDVVDVFEDPVSPELGDQYVIELSRRPRRLLASIADEDPSGPTLRHADTASAHSAPAVSLEAMSRRSAIFTSGGVGGQAKVSVHERLTHNSRGKEMGQPG